MANPHSNPMLELVGKNAAEINDLRQQLHDMQQQMQHYLQLHDEQRSQMLRLNEQHHTQILYLLNQPIAPLPLSQMQSLLGVVVPSPQQQIINDQILKGVRAREVAAQKQPSNQLAAAAASQISVGNIIAKGSDHVDYVNTDMNKSMNEDEKVTENQDIKNAGGAENTLAPSKKRVADVQITKENPGPSGTYVQKPSEGSLIPANSIAALGNKNEATTNENEREKEIKNASGA